MSRNVRLGRAGEATAVVYLEKRGYRIVTTNFYARYGEIDIVARYQDLLIFIEVKTYHTASVEMREVITPAKQRHLWKAAEIYIHRHNCYGQQCRFDLICVSHGRVVDHIENIMY